MHTNVTSLLIFMLTHVELGMFVLFCYRDQDCFIDCDTHGTAQAKMDHFRI